MLDWTAAVTVYEKVELQLKTAHLVMKAQIPSIVLVPSQKKNPLNLPKPTVINCHKKFHKEMMLYQSSY